MKAFPVHDQDGWVLEIYDWDEDTGVGTFVYSKKVPGEAKPHEMTVNRFQPFYPSHRT